MGMVIHDDYWAAAQAMPEKQRAPFLYALIAYGFAGEEPEGSPAWLPTFLVLKDRVALGMKRAAAGSKGGSRSAANGGRRGGVATTSKAKANAKQNGSKSQASDKQRPRLVPCVEDEVEVEIKKGPKGPKEKRESFVPPTPEEVDAYIREKGYSGFDGEGFCAFYASKGWKVGNQPMKNWRQACVTWHKRRQAEHKGTGGGDDGFDDFKI